MTEKVHTRLIELDSVLTELMESPDKKRLIQEQYGIDLEQRYRLNLDTIDTDKIMPLVRDLCKNRNFIKDLHDKE